ncbi:hypothetical protein SAMN05216593_10683 [Pseudomonas asturiensis]|uniref:Uncharacterized protein n=1 Tax=Pseudomonas asturiensis TaxID=1190415 RepID=A0A1M7NIF8_9PSED|nr:hypothetical protein [Pseudomonas asturiensis]SHN03588.1 hypothetical protein SAMN05216593_10683 [Pseudomonas asturiensis]
MAESDYTRYLRFFTPDIRLSHREQSAMTAQELTTARGYALELKNNWGLVLFVPVLFLAALLVVPVDLSTLLGLPAGVDHMTDHPQRWILDVAALVLACWAMYNIMRVKCSVTARYWKTMPRQGVVDLEPHRLVSAINLWSAYIDYDACVVSEWVDGKLTTVCYTGVSQWLLAKTATGQWLVLRHAIKGEMLKGSPEVPTHDLQLHPTQDLVFAFAPRTNLCLGKRFGGNALPVAQSGLWLSESEQHYLGKIAHHYDFFYPQRYSVVSEENAVWIEALIQKTQCSIPSTAGKNTG